MEGYDNDELERVPCPDGACVGTLGADGRCRYCGALGDTPPSPVLRDDADDDGDDGAEDEDDDKDDDLHDDDDPSGDAEDSTDGDDPWEDRQLCPDGSCIGSIGEDGRCRVCGLEAA